MVTPSVTHPISEDGPAQGAAAQPQPLGGPSSGAPDSNTAPNNCKGKDDAYFKLLRWGVDSLYLSYGGGSKLNTEIDAKLESLKALAQERDRGLAALAQLRVGNHIFEVKDRGTGFFPFILEDGAFRIQLAHSTANSLPMAVVKVSSAYLASVKPEQVTVELNPLIEELGMLLAEPVVSRIDLFVDFVTDSDMEGWDRHAWVTHASSINSYSVEGRFSGWSIGVGGVMGARLYDKTLEIKQSGKHYLKHLWYEAAGWDPKETVWRLEFEFKRAYLAQAGLSILSTVLFHRNSLWSYATREWLKLTLPNPDDETRSRWPIRPLWGYLSSIDWESPGGPINRSFQFTRAPSDKRLGQQLLSSLTSFMAARGMIGIDEGVQASHNELRQYLGGESFLEGVSPEQLVKERVQFKARQYNTMLNERKLPRVETPEEKLKREVEEYRRQLDGG